MLLSWNNRFFLLRISALDDRRGFLAHWFELSFVFEFRSLKLKWIFFFYFLVLEAFLVESCNRTVWVDEGILKALISLNCAYLFGSCFCHEMIVALTCLVNYGCRSGLYIEYVDAVARFSPHFFQGKLSHVKYWICFAPLSNNVLIRVVAVWMNRTSFDY